MYSSGYPGRKKEDDKGRPKPKNVQALQCKDCGALWLKDKPVAWEHYLFCEDGYKPELKMWVILYPRKLFAEKEKKEDD